jgi:hypothetical protein
VSSKLSKHIFDPPDPGGSQQVVRAQLKPWCHVSHGKSRRNKGRLLSDAKNARLNSHEGGTCSRRGWQHKHAAVLSPSRPSPGYTRDLAVLQVPQVPGRPTQGIVISILT